MHTLAYPIGGIFHIPHGLSNALVLPHVLRFNATVAAAIYADIATDAFQHLSTIDAPARCGAFISELERLAIRLNIPARLRDVGCRQNALAKLSAHAMKQQRLLVNNPRPISEVDALSIYTAAW